jgi:hypothetical protein
MLQFINLRPSHIALQQVLFAMVLFVLVLLGAPKAHASCQTQEAATTEANMADLFRDNQSPDYHRANAEYWRVKGERMTVRRKGLLGWFLPKRTRHELAEKRRHAHRSAASVHYRGRHGRRGNVWQVLGLKD